MTNPAFYYSNDAVPGTIGNPGGLSSVATSLYLTGTPSGYPGTYPFRLVLAPGGATEEIVHVTAGNGTSGTPWTITRAQDGSTAQAQAQGAEVEHMFTAGDMTLSRAHEAQGSSSPPHGLPASAWNASNFAAISEQLIANNTTNTLTFSSIPQTYKHLLLVVQARLAETSLQSDDITCVINGDTSSVYSHLDIGATNILGAGTSSLLGGAYLCPPVSYAPGTPATLTTTSSTMAAVSSSNVNTGSFIAPPSGSVMVEASFAYNTGGQHAAFGLAAHGTTTPMVASNIEVLPGSNTAYATLKFLVAGLTAGTAYNFDLMFSSPNGDGANIVAGGSTSTSPGSGSFAPVIMTVQPVGSVSDATAYAATSWPICRVSASEAGAAQNVGGGMAWIFNYTGTVFNKMFVGMSGAGDGSTAMVDGKLRWGWYNPASQLAVTSLTVNVPAGTDFLSGSFVGLYGVGG